MASLKRTSLLTIFFISIFLIAKGQQHSDSLMRLHSPVKATVLSALLPGAGQVYNRKYWKVPVLYGAFAGLGYLVRFNDQKFKKYRNAYIARTDNDPSTTDDYVNVYSEENLKTLKDYYRRNRDLSIIFGGLVYILNILDASVDAHLFYFDVSDNLSMKVEPVIENTGIENAPALKVAFKF